MRRSASEVIRNLEMRVARLERQITSSQSKKALLSGLVSKVGDFYAYLNRELPGDAEKNKILSKMVSDLESELITSIRGFQDRGWYGKTRGSVKCSIQSDQLVMSISVDTLGNKDSISLKISEMSDLRDLRVLVSDLKSEYKKDHRQSSRRIPFEVWNMILIIITNTLEKPLFLPLLQGDLDTLIDRVDAPTKKEFERKFWVKLEKASSVAAKVLKALAKVGVGALVVKLCISVLILIPWGVIGMTLLGLLKILLGGMAIVAGGVLGKYLGKAMKPHKFANEVPNDPEERLELFLELLEEEGLA